MRSRDVILLVVLAVMVGFTFANTMNRPDFPFSVRPVPMPEVTASLNSWTPREVANVSHPTPLPPVVEMNGTRQLSPVEFENRWTERLRTRAQQLLPGSCPLCVPNKEPQPQPKQLELPQQPQQPKQAQPQPSKWKIIRRPCGSI